MKEEARAEQLGSARALVMTGCGFSGVGFAWGLIGYFVNSYGDFFCFALLAAGAAMALLGGFKAVRIATDD